MADIWNAIILIDEGKIFIDISIDLYFILTIFIIIYIIVDIFFECQNVHEVNHNALVCVFLRLLEYHQGIVFLTTNRGRNF